MIEIATKALSAIKQQMLKQQQQQRSRVQPPQSQGRPHVKEQVRMGTLCWVDVGRPPFWGGHGPGVAMVTL